MKTQAQAKKEQRLKRRILAMIKTRSALFITMTFKDEVLSKTNKETRKRYIKQFLKNETALYIANIDYGAKNEREHYHAIAITNTLQDVKNEDLKRYLKKLNFKAYKYGDIKAEYIGIKYGFKDESDIKQTAKRLTNHFFKETTKGEKLIYSRGTPSENAQLRRLKRFYKMEREQSRKKQHEREESRQEMSEEQIKALLEDVLDF